jgi:hypothetical protein
MLLDRDEPGDVLHARSLLEEAVSTYNASACPNRGKHARELLLSL